MNRWTALRRVTDELAHEALASWCDEFGTATAATGSWGSREARRIPLSSGASVVLAHDEREAPFVADDPGLLVSFTDEDDLALFAWARPQRDSRLAGIGVDVASAKDFAGERGERFNRLIFSEHEQEFVRTYYFDDPAIGFAYAFSAKEAAFKSLAAPLRAWYEKRDAGGHASDELEFEIREFELEDATHERGTLRHGHAQAAMDAMGIGTITLHHRVFAGMAITLALSFR